MTTIDLKMFSLEMANQYEDTKVAKMETAAAIFEWLMEEVEEQPKQSATLHTLS